MIVLAANVGAGGTGFIVIVLLVLATYLLIRSMSKRIGNVKRNAANWPTESRPQEHDDDEPPSA